MCVYPPTCVCNIYIYYTHAHTHHTYIGLRFCISVFQVCETFQVCVYIGGRAGEEAEKEGGGLATFVSETVNMFKEFKNAKFTKIYRSRVHELFSILSVMMEINSSKHKAFCERGLLAPSPFSTTSLRPEGRSRLLREGPQSGAPSHSGTLGTRASSWHHLLATQWSKIHC